MPPSARPRPPLMATSPVTPAILVAGMVVVVGLSIGRLGVGLYAAWQAYQGRAWRMPGLGWLGPPPKARADSRARGSIRRRMAVPVGMSR